MISLRLSEEEFELLKTRYHTYGARNVSELARLALQRIMNGTPDMSASPGPQDGFAAKLSALDERLHQLESQVALLVDREKEMA